MRRISLAFALMGAVAAAGCGGSVSGTKSGGDQGVAEGTFTVAIQNTAPLTIKGGKVTSVPAGIDCGVGGTGACSASFPNTETVVLTAVATTGNEFFGWAGDCGNDGATCTLTGKADKYIVAQFGTAADRTGHPNWTAGDVHSAKYRAFELQCNACHGLNWKGGSIAPSCYQCHDLDSLTVTAEGGVALGGHFDPANEAWTDHGTGWSQACQRCHTNQGFRDYIGELDGIANNLSGTFLSNNTLTSDTVACRTAGTCDPAAYKFGPLQCKTCHNAVSDPTKAGLTKVMFVSGKTVTADTATGLCGQCHQGRESTTSINTLIGAVAADAQINAAGVSFKNPHYLGAAATVYGADAAGWAQYTGKIYTGANKHGGVASCTFCHDPHTGALPTDAEMPTKCGTCHFDETTGQPVANFLQLEESRQFGFEGDIDGDGTIESVKVEIDGLAATLNAAMVAYSTDVLAAPITYTDAYPYFMNAGGTAYKTFSPRLMRAAFNYKWYKAEPGAWAHNPRYAIEILYDAIADLNAGLAAATKPTITPAGKRAFNGHFGAAEDPEPYAAMMYHATGENWGFTSAACYQCHGGQGGFTAYVASAPAALTSAVLTNKVTSMQCGTCHTFDGTTMKGLRTDVTKVYFPPQKAGAATAAEVVVNATDLPAGNAVCATCHSGRENGKTVTNKGGTDGTFALTFSNPHYLGAAGIMMGDDAKVMFQYPGKTYTKKPVFWAAGTNGNAPGPYGSPHGAQCTGCHQPKASKHTFEVDFSYCATCHTGAYDLLPVEEEYDVATAELLTAIRAYVTTNLAAIQTAVGGDYVAGGTKEMTNVCYDPHANPYFFVETASGCDTTKSFGKFDPKLLKAAFNYQWSQKEPGAWAHNEFYVLQAVYDSIEDLGGVPTFTVGGATTPGPEQRPAVP